MISLLDKIEKNAVVRWISFIIAFLIPLIGLIVSLITKAIVLKELLISNIGNLVLSFLLVLLLWAIIQMRRENRKLKESQKRLIFNFYAVHTLDNIRWNILRKAEIKLFNQGLRPFNPDIPREALRDALLGACGLKLFLIFL